MMIQIEVLNVDAYDSTYPYKVMLPQGKARWVKVKPEGAKLSLGLHWVEFDEDEDQITVIDHRSDMNAQDILTSVHNLKSQILTSRMSRKVILELIKECGDMEMKLISELLPPENSR